MRTTPPVFSADEIRATLTMSDAIESARTAFRALHAQTVESPPPWHLNVSEHRGELHVKGAAVHGAPHLSVKVATGFPGNACHGVPTSDGLTAVVDSATGRIAALFLDGGYLTELRTGAAGALALDLLAPAEVEELAIVGSGGQARFQIEAALHVRTPERITVYGRNEDRMRAFATWIQERADIPVRRAALDDSPMTATAVVTVTPSTVPVLYSHQIRAGTHVTAIGSDGPGKRELEPSLLRRADLIVVDSLHQSQTLGELQGIDLGGQDVVTLGSLLHRRRTDRDPDLLTIADLSGTGAQDAAIAALAARRLLDN
ncbi:ornithine cyclodeaminase [Plantibacter flavus]|uniref:Ornithine cyclodeaminase n=1 Tax=Plantibacter flavus TaxID=150123 RepID=A0A3N2BXW9_9MICO|nr:ornithine cyclodeaminase family protein [Plantibacter flavus]ROR80022.1 ornithine cyclodeaminase [Plantibacter flavus]SMG28626.1 ornithine cyclodeaminase [Plantibacter flavus]